MKKKTESNFSARLKRLSPPALFNGAMIIFIMLLAVLSWFAQDRYSQYQVLHGRTDMIEKYCADFVYYDEVLTMSARMAAYTGDFSWEDRYFAFDEKLTGALKKMMETEPEVFFEDAAGVEDANNKLVEMEKRAFLLVHHGNNKAASDLLQSGEYQRQKNIYKTGVDKISVRLKEIDDVRQAVFQQRTLAGSIAGTVIFSIIFFIMLGITKLLKAYIARMKKSDAGLRSLNESLEAKVLDRTSVLNGINDTLNTELAERRRTEEALRQVNEKNDVIVKKLEERDAQNGDMREMGAFLQSCSTIQEVAPVIMNSMKRLFPCSDGALFLISPSRTDLEFMGKWGDFPEDSADGIFAPDDCWGLTRGGMYVVDDVENGLICRHLKTPPAAAYACLPLIAKGEMLGLLHIQRRSGDCAGDFPRWISNLKEVSPVLTELMSLAISNIRLREKLSYQSIRDPLTGLFNRRYMEESLQIETKRASRGSYQIGVIMADIDHFKKFNDQFGHAAGDAVLIGLANFFKNRLRGSDIACRYGGEEFAFFLPECSQANASMRAGDLAVELKALRIQYIGQTLGPVTLSIGVAAYPVHGDKPEELLRAADTALYRAKKEGRDRIIMA